MPNDQSHDTRTTNPANRLAQAVGLSVAFRAAPPSGSTNWLSHSQVSRAPAPFLCFTDLISGPATGLGDGLGDGVIVTVWAQGIGDSQGDSQIFFTDSLGAKREAAHVYYWKRADGELPSGPSELWYSHLMQEVAFSIPAGSADGEGQITIEKGGNTSNALPFTVRAGNIYHIKSTGTDGSAGSFSDPWLTVEGALRTQNGSNLAPAGSTIYVHDVDSGDMENPPVRAIYWNNNAASSGVENQFSTIAYPGYQPKAIGQSAIESYTVEGWVISKFDVYGSNFPSVDENGQPTGTEYHTEPFTYCIKTVANGRLVANRCGDIPGACASQAQGAISGNKSWISNCKILGNEIYDYGCAGSSVLHHTMYFSVRQLEDVEPWEVGYNFLHGNKAKFGIHSWDKDDSGTPTGPLLVYKNVVVEQAGSGISMGSACNWTCDIYEWDNITIDCGLASTWDGIDPTTTDQPEIGGISVFDPNPTDGFLGKIWMFRNLVDEYTTDGNFPNAAGLMFRGQGDGGGEYDWSQNIMITNIDLPFIGATLNASGKIDKLTGSDNVWYSSVDTPSYSAPSYDAGAITSNPQVSRDGAIVTMASGSPAATAGSPVSFAAIPQHLLDCDAYGVPRSQTPALGPMEAM